MVSKSNNIVFVSTYQHLVEITDLLKTKTAFGFDTEFDRFWREYGFKLLLIQIYDEENCYLIDPIAILDLKPLWQIFEDEQICKIAYACSEDIQLLKMNGCNTKNIFDVQIAAKICNNPGNSFGDLVLDICHTTLDKSLQRSNWRTRPLTTEQQIYASNDVIWLPKLKAHFFEIANKNNLADILRTENKSCEEIVVTPYEVKLSSKQQVRYSTYYKNILLQILILRDEVASTCNLPPFMIFSDATIEAVIENPSPFLLNPFERGFSSKLKNNETYSSKFLAIVNGINNSKTLFAERKEKVVDPNRKKFYINDKEEIEKKWGKIHKHVTNEFGVTSGEFIIRGLKKALQSRPYNEINLKPYQRQVIDETCKTLNIEL